MNYWVHNEFLQLKDIKMSKSLGNILTIPALKEKGYNPLAYRYLALTAHYRSSLQFTWEALDSAQTAFDNLKARVIEIKKDLTGTIDEVKKTEILAKFDAALFNDVSTPQALAVMWEAVKDANLNNATKWAVLSEMDTVLGLKMDEMKEETFTPSEEALKLIEQRKQARLNKDWAKSDELRDTLAKMGVGIKDLPGNQLQIFSLN